MLEATRSVDLHAAAQALGEHPFEVVRLLVMSGHPVGPAIAWEHLEQIRVFGGIETWWTEVELPEDANRARAVVRGVIDQMLQRDLIGERTARRENLFRGLPAGDLEIAQRAVGQLLDLGALVQARASSGAQVAIHPEWAEGARSLVARGQAPPELAEIWEE